MRRAQFRWREQWRLVAARVTSAVGLVVALACGGDLIGVPGGPFLGERPATHLVVSTYPKIIAQGDTLTVTAHAYDSTGYVTQVSAARKWEISDASVARLEPTRDVSHALLRGLTPGRVLVTATTVGFTGRDTVWVVPLSARVTLQLPTTTIRVGDTVSGVMTVQNITSAGLTSRQLIAGTENVTIANFENVDTLGHARLVGRGVGTTRVNATLGRLRDDRIITVVP
jgi:hypothetical protein